MEKEEWTGRGRQAQEEEWREQRGSMPELLMAVMLLAAVFLVSRQAGLMVSGQAVEAKSRPPVVVLDAGHGGCNLRDLKNQK